MKRMTQKRSKSTNNHDNVLEEITSKIANLDSKVGILSDLCLKLEEKLNSFDGNLDTIISHYNFGFEKGVLKSCLNDDNLPRTNVDNLLENRNIFDSQSEVFEKKKELISEWNNLLNQRKQAYWNAIRSEHLANTYEQWKQRENIILPMKYRVKSVRNEQEKETKIKVNLAMQKMEAEITLLCIGSLNTKQNTTNVTKKFRIL